MDANFSVGWVKPPTPTNGLDHLGAQAPCIFIYNQLLPGITNVTNRARYYSFYLWCFNEFEKKGWRSTNNIIRYIRKADCLFTLIAIRHGMRDHDNYAEHAGATVGSDTLIKVINDLDVNGGSINLSTNTVLEPSEHRYFKQDLGGFGQYYFGVLQQLKLMGGKKPQEATLFSNSGTPIAASFEHGEKGSLFMRLLEEDVVSLKDLDELSPFCQCQLKHTVGEKQCLVNLFQGGWPAISSDTTNTPSEDELSQIRCRSESLSLFIQLADVCHENNVLLDMESFRGLTYSLYSQRKTKLDIGNGLLRVASEWQVYQRNEILAVGMQGLFFCMLSAITKHEGAFGTLKEACSWFWHEGEGFDLCGNLGGITLLEYLRHRARALPAFSDWTVEGHECQLSERIVSVTKSRHGVDEILSLLDNSLGCIAAVCCREENNDGYGPVRFHPRYFDKYPVNLNSANELVSNAFGHLSLLDALTTFCARFCFENHVRVTLRKLGASGKNTNRFEMNENGLYIRSVPPATHTSPRFDQAIRILRDLGLLVKDGDLLAPSPAGREFMAASA